MATDLDEVSSFDVCRFVILDLDTVLLQLAVLDDVGQIESPVCESFRVPFPSQYFVVPLSVPDVVLDDEFLLFVFC